ncbi:hypothetical protein MA16_Dca004583 [Dendrobium catenatum]|uniref:Uncharacterized protein n=1 Tax=Dendrobium catenatum TaxID=906689 RepID=A0A2I0VNI3_9ASPA|nr:hypothetical protein MA16_Dca004583 [Dendrobium catenatum]
MVLNGVAPAAHVMRLYASEVVVLKFGLNYKNALSCADNVSIPCGLAENGEPCVGAEPFGSLISTSLKMIDHVESSPMVVVSPTVVSSSVNLVSNRYVHDHLGLSPNDSFEGNVRFVNISISVISNVEMKAHMAKSGKNDVLLQINWLVLEDSFSFEESDSQDFEGEIVDRSINRGFLNVGGKKHKSKGKKK